MCSTVPEAGKGMPYALVHTELRTGLQTAPQGFQAASVPLGSAPLLLLAYSLSGSLLGSMPCHHAVV